MIDWTQLLGAMKMPGQTAQQGVRQFGNVFNPQAGLGGGQAQSNEQPEKTPWLNQDSYGGLSKGEMLMAGAGMLSGKNLQQGIGNAAQFAYGSMERNRKKQEEEAKKKQMQMALAGIEMTPEQRAIAAAAPDLALGQVAQTAFAPPSTPEQFTLSENQVRYDSAGNVIAQGMEKARDPINVNGVLVDPVTYEPVASFQTPSQSGGMTDYQQQQLEIRRREAAAAEAAAAASAGQPDASAEGTFRKEYLNQSQDFLDVQRSYSKIKELDTSNAPGQMGLIFNIMKMYDPGSTVREGEFANAENARGVPGSIQNAYNKLLGGEFLTDKQITQFIGTADSLYKSAGDDYSRTYETYKKIAPEYEFDPARTVPDLRQESLALPPEGGGPVVWQTPAGVGVTESELAEASSALLDDLSPQNMEAFDKAYGPGAARILLQELGIPEPGVRVPMAPYDPAASGPYQGPVR